MISVLLVLIGCPAKVDTRSENANITEIKVGDTKADIKEALSSGWKTTVSYATNKVTLIVKPEDSNASLKVTCNNTQVAHKDDKTKFECPLNEGDNTIKVVVTAEKGNNTKTATIIVYRKERVKILHLKH